MLIPQPSHTLKPYFALVIGILALSLSAMFVRWANAPGPITALYRTFFATLILTPLIVQRNYNKNGFAQGNILFPILGGVFTGLDFALWNTSVTYTTAANATLLGNTAPLWVALTAWLLLKERFGPGFWRGLVLALGGATLVIGTDFLLHPHLGLGDAMALGASMFYAGYMITTQRGRESMDTLSLVWLVGLSASFSLVIINLLFGNRFVGYPIQTWLVFLASAIVSQVIGYQAITYALGHLPASVVSPTMVAQPILTAVLAIPLLGETPGLWQVLGGIVALVGIYQVNQSHMQKAHSHTIVD